MIREENWRKVQNENFTNVAKFDCRFISLLILREVTMHWLACAHVPQNMSFEPSPQHLDIKFTQIPKCTTEASSLFWKRGDWGRNCISSRDLGLVQIDENQRSQKNRCFDFVRG